MEKWIITIKEYAVFFLFLRRVNKIQIERTVLLFKCTNERMKIMNMKKHRFLKHNFFFNVLKKLLIVPKKMTSYNTND